MQMLAGTQKLENLPWVNRILEVNFKLTSTIAWIHLIFQVVVANAILTYKSRLSWNGWGSADKELTVYEPLSPHANVWGIASEQWFVQAHNQKPTTGGR